MHASCTSANLGHPNTILSIWPVSANNQHCTVSQRSSWAFWREKRTRRKIIPDTVEKPFYLALMPTKSMVGRRNITLRCWCQRKWEPLLHGSSLHPKEPLRKKGYHFIIMSLSTEVLLDHIADYLLFLSNAPLFWFTLTTSYNHPCPLILLASSHFAALSLSHLTGC